MEQTFIEILRRAIDEELTRDASVYLLGEDVAAGGAFGVTRGLAEKFGAQRVRNTPISEAAITGVATGAALCGLKPVLEIMFIDFATLAMDTLVNQTAKYRYMSGGQLAVPLVVRTQAGAAGGAAAQHSQSLESWFIHVPGLVVVAPSSPAEAYGLLKSAIRPIAVAGAVAALVPAQAATQAADPQFEQLAALVTEKMAEYNIQVEPRR